MEKGRLGRPSLRIRLPCGYRVDSISKPQASSKGSGMYLEFLFRRAHSRSRVERKYWSGDSLYSCTTCSNSVIVGVTGPIGSGLPQLGFPRRFAMGKKTLSNVKITTSSVNSLSLIPKNVFGIHVSLKKAPVTPNSALPNLRKLLIIIGFWSIVNRKMHSGALFF